MSEVVKLIVEKFEGFIKRAILPSATFVFVYIALYMCFGKLYDENIVSNIYLPIDANLKVYVYGILFIGLSYFLSMFQQAIFDNFIKENYSNGKELTILRAEIKKQLKKDKNIEDDKDNWLFTDYLIYQMTAKGKETSRYVDETKAIGIAILSVMINLIISSVLLIDAMGYLIIGFLFLVGLFYRLGLYLIKKKYESRAIRLYVNYLYS
ncbi:hypothetical protein [Sulfuricurvum sp.]|uniref:hypothetical protein n=1 Tax=Sulfuricurvum sp. TaxID=2025608 RepID=UPI003BB049EC